MSLAALSYIAELLKFVAVPFAIFELVDRKSRERVEGVIIALVKYNARLFIILFICTLVAFLLLAFGAEYLFATFVIIYFVVTVFVRLVVSTTSKTDPMTGFVVGIVSAIPYYAILVAALIAWPLPDTWLVHMMRPASWLLDSIRSLHDGAAALIPQFDAGQYIESYRASAKKFEEGIWSVFRWMIIMYIWASDGLMLLALILLEVSLVILIVSAVVSFITIPLALFVKLSELLKHSFYASEKGILPLGGLAVWAAGELLNVSISTYKFFWMAP